MTRPHRPTYTPPTVHRPEVTRCKRTCCWTPYGHTPRHDCTCHTGGER
jgi:hypothetical protein